MKKTKLIRVLWSLAVVIALGCPYITRAVPYASSVSEAGGTVTFVLNEAADSVKVAFTGPSSTLDLGARAAGTHTFARGAATSFQIQVTKSAPPVWTQITADTNSLVQFFAPLSVSVNRNPASPNFGRIYVLEDGGQVGGGRLTTEGIFVLNADISDVLGQGNDGLKGGLDSMNIFIGTGTSDRYDPFQIEVGDDDYVYITDANDPRGALLRVDANVSNGEEVLSGIGNTINPTVHTVLYGVHTKGSLSAGNLTVWATDGQWVDNGNPANNSILRWDIGSGPLPYNAPPTLVANPGPSTERDSDIDVAPDGNIFMTASFDGGTGITGLPAIQEFSPSGTLLWSSIVNGAEMFTNSYSLEVSPDGTKLAVIRRDRQTWIIGLTNGPSGRIPDVSTTTVVPTFTVGSGNGRTVNWDIAGNLYVANRSTERLRIFSPGGTTTANTGSDGTFSITVPQTTVTVTNSTPSISEGSASTVVFTVSRTGNTASPLTVSFLFPGTATNGVDFTPAIPTSITLAGGVVSTNITVSIVDDSIAEFTETLTLSLNSGTNYSVGTPGSYTTTILDNETPEISVGLPQSENRLLEGYSHGKVPFFALRKGLLTSAVTANLSYSGSATLASDFDGPSSVTIAAGAISSTNFNITSLNDQSYEGTETVIIGASSGSGYNAGSETGTAFVIDDEVSPGSVLFTDNFNTASSDTSTNWAINSLDSFADSHADFGFDYTTLGIPRLPGGTDTLGLRLRCNQLSSAARNCISLSPVGINLPSTNDYRMTFNMWINYNGPMFDGGSGSTFHLNAGVGTTGDHPNYHFWATADGIWFSIDGEGGTSGDCNIYNSATLELESSGFYAAGTQSGVRDTSHAYYSLWGGNEAPAAQLASYPSQTGTSGSGNMGMSWHTVVVTKLTNIVQWTIDGVVIASVTNDPGTWAGNNVFIGYYDAFLGSLSSVPDMSFAIVDNFKLETYTDNPPVATAPTIGSVTKSGGNIVINFTGSASDTAGDFSLRGSSTLSSNSAAYTPVSGANITGSAGTFQATAPISGTMMFYRIQR